MASTTTFAGREFTKEQITATLAMFRRFREFIRAEPGYYIRDPRYQGWFSVHMTQDAAQKWLAERVNIAINRKAGEEPKWRRLSDEWQDWMRHDCREIRAHINDRVRLWGLNGRRFATDIIQKRYGHLLEG